MNDITRKQMKDVIVPQNDIIRRPVAVPEQYVVPMRDDEGDRIGKNPFFKKPQKEPISQRPKGSGMRGILVALLFVLLLAGGFALANYFASATIEISPITRSIKLDNNLIATKDGSGNELVFDSTTLSEEKTKEVLSTIEKKMQIKSSGKVVIYNAYSIDSQRLIKNTRLKDNETLKIYHIDTSIVVPGAKIINGKVVTPGSVEVVVYADAPGDSYDIKIPSHAGDFSIPGFAGDPRFTKFYGRMSEKAPISGGYLGSAKVPSDEAIKAAQEELKQDLKKIVVEKARANIPTDKTFFPGSMVVKFEEVPEDFTALETAKVSMRAIVSVFFFDSARLTEKLALEALPEDKNNPFLISNMSSLEFKFVDEVNNVVLSDLSKIHFHIGGTADFVGQIATKNIQDALVGKSKKDFSEIIKKQVNISEADAVIRPMWKTIFPIDPAKITIKVITKQ